MRTSSEHSSAQCGAVKGCSTTHGLVHLLHNILASLDDHKAYARILLLDFSEAFDHIYHNILLPKLESNNIPKVLVSWQRAFLTQRTQRVKIDNILSDTVYINGGVPQGTLSGPEDFMHMLDDFTTCVDDIKYVDDTSLYEIVCRGENSRMQEAADNAVKWAVAVAGTMLITTLQLHSTLQYTWKNRIHN